QELFAFLVFNHEQMIRKDALVDMLWPYLQWDKGISLLYSTIYYVRKTLQSINYNIDIKNYENYYLLTLNDVKVDVKLWENQLMSLGPLTKGKLSDYLKVIKLYRGDYLQQHNYYWAEIEQKRLRTIWLYCVKE